MKGPWQITYCTPHSYLNMNCIWMRSLNAPLHFTNIFLESRICWSFTAKFQQCDLLTFEDFIISITWFCIRLTSLFFLYTFVLLCRLLLWVEMESVIKWMIVMTSLVGGEVDGGHHALCETDVDCLSKVYSCLETCHDIPFTLYKDSIRCSMRNKIVWICTALRVIVGLWLWDWFACLNSSIPINDNKQHSHVI